MQGRVWAIRGGQKIEGKGCLWQLQIIKMNSLRNLFSPSASHGAAQTAPAANHNWIHNPLGNRTYSDAELDILENALYLRCCQMKKEISHYQKKFEGAGRRGFSTESLRLLRLLEKLIQEKHRLDKILLDVSLLRNSRLVAATAAKKNRQ